MEESIFDELGRRKYLNLSECRRFVAATSDLSVERETFCLLIYFTGCRISEALDTKYSSIDSEGTAIIVRTLKKRRRKEYRRIPIPKDLLNRLLRLPSPSKNKLLFSFSRSTGWRAIKEVMSNANIEGLQATTKGLRHAFGVRCAIEKIPINLIQRWMGHSDPSTTAIYMNIIDDEERQFARKTWKTR